MRAASSVSAIDLLASSLLLASMPTKVIHRGPRQRPEFPRQEADYLGFIDRGAGARSSSLVILATSGLLSMSGRPLRLDGRLRRDPRRSKGTKVSTEKKWPRPGMTRPYGPMKAFTSGGIVKMSTLMGGIRFSWTSKRRYRVWVPRLQKYRLKGLAQPLPGTTASSSLSGSRPAPGVLLLSVRWSLA